MTKIKQSKCQTCGKKIHDFEKEEAMDCIPPVEVLQFGQYAINKEYRETLYKEYPFYTSEEVVGSYLGHNPHFPSQETWVEEQNENSREEE